MSSIDDLKVKLDSELDSFVAACRRELDKKDCRIVDLDEEIDDKDKEIEGFKEQLSKPPEWGNCRRGCPPAYLDAERFCSPGCKAGGARGQFYSVPEEKNVLPISQAS